MTPAAAYRMTFSLCPIGWCPTHHWTCSVAIVAQFDQSRWSCTHALTCMCNGCLTASTNMRLQAWVRITSAALSNCLIADFSKKNLRFGIDTGLFLVCFRRNIFCKFLWVSIELGHCSAVQFFFSGLHSLRPLLSIALTNPYVILRGATLTKSRNCLDHLILW